MRTASITPDMAANYLVEAVPGLVKRDDAPAGRAIVMGAGGIALELRGGGDEGDEGDADGSSSSVKLPSESRDPPKARRDIRRHRQPRQGQEYRPEERRRNPEGWTGFGREVQRRRLRGMRR